jgi:hypothetical protein
VPRADGRRNEPRSKPGWRPCRTASGTCSKSPHTVEIYRANLLTKMQAASLSNLVRMALIAGILDTETRKSS